jgi:hypothetical protein
VGRPLSYVTAPSIGGDELIFLCARWPSYAPGAKRPPAVTQGAQIC